MAAFDDPRVVSGYHVELFETPDDRVIADDPIGRIALRRSLEELLASFGCGARSYVTSAVGRTPVLELQLTTGAHPALIDNLSGLSHADVSLAPPPASIDHNPERHEEVLGALQAHPLVRAILPPVLLHITDEESAHTLGAAFDLMTEPLSVPKPAPDAVYPVVGVIDSGVAAVLDDWVVGRFDYLSA